MKENKINTTATTNTTNTTNWRAEEEAENQLLLTNLNNLFRGISPYKNENPTFKLEELPRGPHDTATYLTMYLTQKYSDGSPRRFRYRKICVEGESAQGILYSLFTRGDVV